MTVCRNNGVETDRLLALGALAVLTAGLLLVSPLIAEAQNSQSMLAQEPACQAVGAAAAGAAMPIGQDVAVLRWLGTANYELSYRGQIVLFDAFYSRVPPARPLGVLPSEFTQADAIFIGHGHWDHIADAPEVAQQTGAVVHGGPPSTEWLAMMGVPESQLVTWMGGETKEFDGFTVQAIHGQHSGSRPPAVGRLMSLYGESIDELVRPQTAEEQEQLQALRSRGARGPRVGAEGTINYLITFDDGFRIVFADTNGPITDEAKAVMANIPRTDITIVPYAGRFNAALQNQNSMPYVHTYKPRVVLPSHHEDETGVGAHFDMPVYGLGMAVREAFPDARTIDPLYLSALCFDTKTKDLFIGK
jgi:L-ascorbate metabolism protein UlaG (beta-lactamase superfamily)